MWKQIPIRRCIFLSLVAAVFFTSPIFAERMLITCSGTLTIHDDRGNHPEIIFDEFFFIDLESHDLVGTIGSYKIFLYEENAVMFNAGTRGEETYVEGYMDIYSGNTRISVYAKDDLVRLYELNCKP